MTSTKLQIRQFTAIELGGEGTGGFLANTATGGTVSTLLDTAWPLNTNLNVSKLYSDAWILRPSASTADRVRVVSTYTPAGGILVPDLNWTVAPVAGETYELHTIMEPQTALLRCINDSLLRIMVETELALTPVGGSTQHSLETVAPWLTNKSWVRQVGWLNSSEDRNEVNPYERVVRGEAYELDGAVVLSHPGNVFGSLGQSPNPYIVYVRCMKPAYYGCTTAGGVAQSGLTLDSDIAPVSADWAAWGAIVEAWRRYSQALEASSRARLIPNRTEAAGQYTTRTRNQGRWPTLTFRPLMVGGPLRIGSGSLPIAYRATTA